MPEPLFGKTLEELRQVSESLGLPPFTARQLAQWIYQKGVRDFEQMTNLSLKARDLLRKNHVPGLKDPIDVQESADGTKKYLFPTPPGRLH